MASPRNTAWRVCGRQLLLDGRTFFIRGVNYAPTPIGRPGRLDMLGHEEIFTRDLANLRAMHANAVKTYDYYSNIDHTRFLDAAYNGGKEPIYTIFSVWIDQTLMEPVISIDSPEFRQMVQNYFEMARDTSFHPGVIGYSIGGEMNSIVVIRDPTFWEKFQLLTAAVRRGQEVNGNAEKIITTTFVDDGGMSFTAGEEFGADVDLWGSNVYQTNYEGSVIPTYMRVPTTKPLLVSEYGYPYASNRGEGDAEQLDHVAKLLTRQTEAMERNFNRTDALREQIVVGGFVFEYSDEWWKAGAAHIHDLGLTVNRQFPLGYLSEEFFGLYRVARPIDVDKLKENAVDVLYPRPTVEMLAEIWGRGRLPGEGELSIECGPSESLASLHQSHDLSRRGTPEGFLLPVVALCALGSILLAMYSTLSRRAAYHRLDDLTFLSRSHGRQRVTLSNASDLSSAQRHEVHDI